MLSFWPPLASLVSPSADCTKNNIGLRWRRFNYIYMATVYEHTNVLNIIMVGFHDKTILSIRRQTIIVFVKGNITCQMARYSISRKTTGWYRRTLNEEKMAKFYFIFCSKTGVCIKECFKNQLKCFRMELLRLCTFDKMQSLSNDSKRWAIGRHEGQVDLRQTKDIDGLSLINRIEAYWQNGTAWPGCPKMKVFNWKK